MSDVAVIDLTINSDPCAPASTNTEFSSPNLPLRSNEAASFRVSPSDGLMQSPLKRRLDSSTEMEIVEDIDDEIALAIAMSKVEAEEAAAAISASISTSDVSAIGSTSVTPARGSVSAAPLQTDPVVLENSYEFETPPGRTAPAASGYTPGLASASLSPPADASTLSSKVPTPSTPVLAAHASTLNSKVSLSTPTAPSPHSAPPSPGLSSDANLQSLGFYPLGCRVWSTQGAGIVVGRRPVGGPSPAEMNYLVLIASSASIASAPSSAADTVAEPVILQNSQILSRLAAVPGTRVKTATGDKIITSVVASPVSATSSAAATVPISEPQFQFTYHTIEGPILDSDFRAHTSDQIVALAELINDEVKRAAHQSLCTSYEWQIDNLILGRLQRFSQGQPSISPAAAAPAPTTNTTSSVITSPRVPAFLLSEALPTPVSSRVLQAEQQQKSDHVGKHGLAVAKVHQFQDTTSKLEKPIKMPRPERTSKDPKDDKDVKFQKPEESKALPACPRCHSNSWDGGLRERTHPGGFCDKCRSPRNQRCCVCSLDLCGKCLGIVAKPEISTKSRTSVFVYDPALITSAMENVEMQQTIPAELQTLSDSAATLSQLFGHIYNKSVCMIALRCCEPPLSMNAASKWLLVHGEQTLSRQQRISFVKKLDLQLTAPLTAQPKPMDVGGSHAPVPPGALQVATTWSVQTDLGWQSISPKMSEALESHFSSKKNSLLHIVEGGKKYRFDLNRMVQIVGSSEQSLRRLEATPGNSNHAATEQLVGLSPSLFSSSVIYATQMQLIVLAPGFSPSWEPSMPVTYQFGSSFSASGDQVSEPTVASGSAYTARVFSLLDGSHLIDVTNPNAVGLANSAACFNPSDNCLNFVTPLSSPNEKSQISGPPSVSASISTSFALSSIVNHGPCILPFTQGENKRNSQIWKVTKSNQLTTTGIPLTGLGGSELEWTSALSHSEGLSFFILAHMQRITQHHKIEPPTYDRYAQLRLSLLMSASNTLRGKPLMASSKSGSVNQGDRVVSATKQKPTKPTSSAATVFSSSDILRHLSSSDEDDLPSTIPAPLTRENSRSASGPANPIKSSTDSFAQALSLMSNRARQPGPTHVHSLVASPVANASQAPISQQLNSTSESNSSPTDVLNMREMFQAVSTRMGLSDSVESEESIADHFGYALVTFTSSLHSLIDFVSTYSPVNSDSYLQLQHFASKVGLNVVEANLVAMKQFKNFNNKLDSKLPDVIIQTHSEISTIPTSISIARAIPELFVLLGKRTLNNYQSYSTTDNWGKCLLEAATASVSFIISNFFGKLDAFLRISALLDSGLPSSDFSYVLNTLSAHLLLSLNERPETFREGLQAMLLSPLPYLSYSFNSVHPSPLPQQWLMWILGIGTVASNLEEKKSDEFDKMSLFIKALFSIYKQSSLPEPSHSHSLSSTQASGAALSVLHSLSHQLIWFSDICKINSSDSALALSHASFSALLSITESFLQQVSDITDKTEELLKPLAKLLFPLLTAVGASLSQSHLITSLQARVDSLLTNLRKFLQLMNAHCVSKADLVDYDSFYSKQVVTEITTPITVESAHPYALGKSFSKTVCFPGAHAIILNFDPRCATISPQDTLSIHPQTEHHKSRKNGPAFQSSYSHTFYGRTGSQAPRSQRRDFDLRGLGDDRTSTWPTTNVIVPHDSIVLTFNSKLPNEKHLSEAEASPEAFRWGYRVFARSLFLPQIPVWLDLLGTASALAGAISSFLVAGRTSTDLTTHSSNRVLKTEALLRSQHLIHSPIFAKGLSRPTHVFGNSLALPLALESFNVAWWSEMSSEAALSEIWMRKFVDGEHLNVLGLNELNELFEKAPYRFLQQNLIKALPVRISNLWFKAIRAVAHAMVKHSDIELELYAIFGTSNPESNAKNIPTSANYSVSIEQRRQIVAERFTFIASKAKEMQDWLWIHSKVLQSWQDFFVPIDASSKLERPRSKKLMGLVVSRTVSINPVTISSSEQSSLASTRESPADVILGDLDPSFAKAFVKHYSSRPYQQNCARCGRVTRMQLSPFPRWRCDSPLHQGPNNLTRQDPIVACSTVEACNFGVCVSCSEVQKRQVRGPASEPSHFMCTSGHPLVFFPNSSPGPSYGASGAASCDQCHRSFLYVTGGGYNCSDCNYDLCTSCAAMVPPREVATLLKEETAIHSPPSPQLNYDFNFSVAEFRSEMEHLSEIELSSLCRIKRIPALKGSSPHSPFEISNAINLLYEQLDRERLELQSYARSHEAKHPVSSSDSDDTFRIKFNLHTESPLRPWHLLPAQFAKDNSIANVCFMVIDNAFAIMEFSHSASPSSLSQSDPLELVPQRALLTRSMSQEAGNGASAPLLLTRSLSVESASTALTRSNITSGNRVDDQSASKPSEFHIQKGALLPIPGFEHRVEDFRAWVTQYCQWSQWQSSPENIFSESLNATGEESSTIESQAPWYAVLRYLKSNAVSGADLLTTASEHHIRSALRCKGLLVLSELIGSVSLEMARLHIAGKVVTALDALTQDINLMQHGLFAEEKSAVGNEISLFDGLELCGTSKALVAANYHAFVSTALALLTPSFTSPSTSLLSPNSLATALSDSANPGAKPAFTSSILKEKGFRSKDLVSLVKKAMKRLPGVPQSSQMLILSDLYGLPFRVVDTLPSVRISLFLRLFKTVSVRQFASDFDKQIAATAARKLLRDRALAAIAAIDARAEQEAAAAAKEDEEELRVTIEKGGSMPSSFFQRIRSDRGRGGTFPVSERPIRRTEAPTQRSRRGGAQRHDFGEWRGNHSEPGFHSNHPFPFGLPASVDWDSSNSGLPGLAPPPHQSTMPPLKNSSELPSRGAISVRGGRGGGRGGIAFDRNRAATHAVDPFDQSASDVEIEHEELFSNSSARYFPPGFTQSSSSSRILSPQLSSYPPTNPGFSFPSSDGSLPSLGEISSSALLGAQPVILGASSEGAFLVSVTVLPESVPPWSVPPTAKIYVTLATAACELLNILAEHLKRPVTDLTLLV